MPVSGTVNTTTDRPTTFKSGTTTQPRYSVQHRSDILLLEQTETVRNAQNTLLQILNDLESAKNEEEIETLRSDAQAAKEKAESAIMVLQILYKVNSELDHARKDLEVALEYEKGDIMAARKRVMWLEDRMGALCGKIKLRGQPQKHTGRHRGSDERGRDTFRSDTDDMSDDDTFTTRQRTLPPIMSRQPDSEEEEEDTQRGGRGFRDMSMSGSEDFSHLHHQRSAFMDSPSEASTSLADHAPLKLPTNMSSVDQTPRSEFEKHDGKTDIDSHETEKTEQSEKETATARTEETEDGKKSATTGETEETEETEETGSSDSTEDSDKEEEENDDEDEGEEEDDEDENDKKEVEDEEDRNEEEDFEDTETLKSTVQTTSEEVEVLSPKKSERTMSHATEAEDEVKELGIKDKRGQTFITEVSVATNKSRVTIVTPKREREDTRQVKKKKRKIRFPAFLRELESEEHDIIVDYWTSEHHRFEYGDYSDVLCKLDPLSYHQMGLAVPGTFLDRHPQEYKQLPWHIQSSGGTDIMDIHKIALDKLAIRIHKIYDKIYQAAMLSVEVVRKSKRRESKLFPTQSSLANRETSMLSSTTVSTKNEKQPPISVVSSRPQTMQSVATVTLPTLEKRRLGTSKSGRLVYYPKPIPPPELLPLTRTTVGKEYPRPANTFSDPDPEKRKPAIRVANQRNLEKETKLTLYKERTRAGMKGPSSTEKKFRLMLEQERSAGNSRKSTATKLTFSRAATKISEYNDEEDIDDFKSEVLSENEGSIWSRIKPKNKSREYSGLKWERVKTMVHKSLVSERPEERVDAAKHLGLLRCGDTMVFYALKERMKVDDDQRVRYEATKSLILIGCWEEEVLQNVLKYLAVGNQEIRSDLIKTMIEGKNVQYVNKNIIVFPEIVKILSHFCCNPDHEDPIALDSAVLLGKLCVADENAKKKLKHSLEHTSDTHVKAKSLEILVRQLNCTDMDIVRSITDMVNSSYVWKNRALAANLLITLGPKNVLKGPEDERIYEILERRLWDEPCQPVRLAAAKALTALGLFSKACDRIEKQLEHNEEDIRARAVISVGTLGMKNEKTIRTLLEMFELDTSDYVRLMIVRTFMSLNTTDKRVLRALKEKEKADGALAREARKAIKALESLRELSTPVGRKTNTPPTRGPTHLSQNNAFKQITQSA